MSRYTPSQRIEQAQWLATAVGCEGAQDTIIDVVGRVESAAQVDDIDSAEEWCAPVLM